MIAVFVVDGRYETISTEFEVPIDDGDNGVVGVDWVGIVTSLTLRDGERANVVEGVSPNLKLSISGFFGDLGERGGVVAATWYCATASVGLSTADLLSGLEEDSEGGGVVERSMLANEGPKTLSIASVELTPRVTAVGI